MSNHHIKQSEEATQAPLSRKNIHTNTWLLFLIISLLFSFSSGLFLIWISIDRTDLAYKMYKIQQSIGNGQGHTTKLEVERDSLLSPYKLDSKAEELGLTIAEPGQVRRLIK